MNSTVVESGKKPPSQQEPNPGGKEAVLRQPTSQAHEPMCILQQGQCHVQRKGKAMLGSHLDFPFAVGVAIHRRQYTFFLSSINDICEGKQRMSQSAYNTGVTSLYMDKLKNKRVPINRQPCSDPGYPSSYTQNCTGCREDWSLLIG